MKARNFLAIALAVSFPSAAFAKGNGVIERFTRLSTPVFDASGNEVERIDSKKLPQSVAVEGFSSSGNLKVTINGRTMYFRRGDVKFNGPPTCTVSPEVIRGPEGQILGASATRGGAKAGAGSGDGQCIPVN